VGRAVDFRIIGVPNEALRDYLRTFPNVGVGYYPNSTFVHFDARDAPAYWVDYSRPGQPPQYRRSRARRAVARRGKRRTRRVSADDGDSATTTAPTRSESEPVESASPTEEAETLTE
jgi:hypothetical protein